MGYDTGKISSMRGLFSSQPTVILHENRVCKRGTRLIIFMRCVRIIIISMTCIYNKYDVYLNPPIWGGDVAQLVEYRTGSLLTKVRFPSSARDFSP